MPDYQVGYWISFLVNGPVVITQILLMFIWLRYNAKLFLIVVLICESILMVFLPLIPVVFGLTKQSDEWISFIVLLIFYALCTGF